MKEKWRKTTYGIDDEGVCSCFHELIEKTNNNILLNFIQVNHTHDERYGKSFFAEFFRSNILSRRKTSTDNGVHFS